MEKEKLNDPIMNIGDEFRRFREDILNKHKEKYELMEKERDVYKNAKDKFEDIKQIISESGINLEEILEKMQEAQKEELERFLEEVRPNLINRDVNFDERLIREVNHSNMFDQMDCSQAALIGADIVEYNVESSENVESKDYFHPLWPWPRRPILLFPEARIVKITKNDTGDGCGCGVSILGGGSTIDWYYTWTPPNDGNYHVFANLEYHGFYIAKAQDDAASCKSASVYANISMGLTQNNFIMPGVEKTIIQRGSDNLNEMGRLDGSIPLSSSQFLIKGKPVFIHLPLLLDVAAKGSGSYAELNFEDGEGYIVAPVVVIRKI